MPKLSICSWYCSNNGSREAFAKGIIAWNLYPLSASFCVAAKNKGNSLDTSLVLLPGKIESIGKSVSKPSSFWYLVLSTSIGIAFASGCPTYIASKLCFFL